MSSSGRVLASLCYLNDAESDPMPIMLVTRDRETIKRDLREMVRHVVGTALAPPKGGGA